MSTDENPPTGEGWRPSRDTDEHDAALERRMEITQLKAGDVLTAENAAEIQLLFNELEEEFELNANIRDEGLQAGREQAAGADVADLLRKIDDLKIELAAQKALARFYRKSNGAPALPQPPAKER